MREKRVRLSEQEKELLASTRAAVYGDGEVPYGIVVKEACRALLAREDDSEVRL